TGCQRPSRSVKPLAPQLLAKPLVRLRHEPRRSPPSLHPAFGFPVDPGQGVLRTVVTAAPGSLLTPGDIERPSVPAEGRSSCRPNGRALHPYMTVGGINVSRRPRKSFLLKGAGRYSRHQCSF